MNKSYILIITLFFSSICNAQVTQQEKEIRANVEDAAAKFGKGNDAQLLQYYFNAAAQSPELSDFIWIMQFIKNGQRIEGLPKATATKVLVDVPFNYTLDSDKSGTKITVKALSPTSPSTLAQIASIA